MPRKYPIHTLKVGEELLIPWLTLPDGSRHPTQRPIHLAIAQDERRYNKKYHKYFTPVGVMVRRVK